MDFTKKKQHGFNIARELIELAVAISSNEKWGPHFFLWDYKHMEELVRQQGVCVEQFTEESTNDSTEMLLS